MKIYLGTGLLVAATLAFILQLALPSSAPAVAMRAGIGWVVETLRSSTTVGAYKLFLRDGESASALSSSEADALLAEKAAGAPSLTTLVGGPDATCSLIRGSGSGHLLVCAPTTLTGLDPATPLTEEAAIALRATVEAQQERLAYDETVKATWYPYEFEEQRLAARTQGLNVGNAYPVINDMSGHQVHACILDWEGGSEMLGYAWVGGDAYLVWGWAETRRELDALLIR
jgi:hypothetical protein